MIAADATPMVAAQGMPSLALAIAVAAFRVEAAEIMSPSRGKARCALARQFLMYVLHVECGLPVATTARLLRRHRSTVEHACGVIEDHRDAAHFDRAITLLAATLLAQSTPLSTEGVYSVAQEPS